MEYTIIYMALIPTGWTGFFYAITMLLGTVGFLFAVLRAVYIYLTALVVRGLLYALAPIFIALAMLKATKSLFDGWLQQLISYTLQPVLLFAFLSVFFEIITSFIDILGVSSISGATDICYMESVTFSEGLNKRLYWWSFSDSDGINAKGGIHPELSVNLTVLFTFMVLSYMMIMFGTWAIEVANHMAAGFMSAGGPVASGWATLRQKMLKPPTNTVTPGGYGDSRGFLGSVIGDSKKKVKR
jgi:type IV secretory pathway VirB6-like protein